MNTLETAENLLEHRHQQEERECEHEYHRITSDIAKDNTEFVTAVCIHCNCRRQFEV